MGFYEAAERILRKTKKPMRPQEITELALKQNLLKTTGKTPSATMGAGLYTDILRKGKNSQFIQVDRGYFGLRDLKYIQKRKFIPKLRENISKGIVKEYSDLMSDDYLDDVVVYLENKSGIYALYGENEALWYVGLANNLKTRLLQHQKDRHQRKWTKFRVFVVPKNRLNAVETILIQIARPNGNRTKGNIRGAKNITNEIRKDFYERIKRYKRF